MIYLLITFSGHLFSCMVLGVSWLNLSLLSCIPRFLLWIFCSTIPAGLSVMKARTELPLYASCTLIILYCGQLDRSRCSRKLQSATWPFSWKVLVKYLQGICMFQIPWNQRNSDGRQWESLKNRSIATGAHTLFLHFNSFRHRTQKLLIH